MDPEVKMKIDVLKDCVIKMSMFQAKLTLMMILGGLDFWEAIEYVDGLRHTLEKDLK